MVECYMYVMYYYFITVAARGKSNEKIIYFKIGSIFTYFASIDSPPETG